MKTDAMSDLQYNHLDPFCEIRQLFNISKYSQCQFVRWTVLVSYRAAGTATQDEGVSW